MKNSQSSKAIKNPIKRNMLIMQIVAEFPEVAPILMGYGLHCVGCHISTIETLEQGAKAHGMDDETINLMVQDANEIIKRVREED